MLKDSASLLFWFAAFFHVVTCFLENTKKTRRKTAQEQNTNGKHGNGKALGSEGAKSLGNGVCNDQKKEFGRRLQS
jgi:hypothetical protein